MATIIPVTKHVIATAGPYMVRVLTASGVTDPDQVRLYRNRTRVLLQPEFAGVFVVHLLDAHAFDLLEASTADGSHVTLQVTDAMAPIPPKKPAGTPIRETVKFTGEAETPKPSKESQSTERPLRE